MNSVYQQCLNEHRRWRYWTWISVGLGHDTGGVQGIGHKFQGKLGQNKLWNDNIVDRDIIAEPCHICLESNADESYECCPVGVGNVHSASLRQDSGQEEGQCMHKSQPYLPPKSINTR